MVNHVDYHHLRPQIQNLGSRHRIEIAENLTPGSNISVVTAIQRPMDLINISMVSLIVKETVIPHLREVVDHMKMNMGNITLEWKFLFSIAIYGLRKS